VKEEESKSIGMSLFHLTDRIDCTYCSCFIHIGKRLKD
jgi:hypothetical protein